MVARRYRHATMASCLCVRAVLTVAPIPALQFAVNFQFAPLDNGPLSLAQLLLVLLVRRVSMEVVVVSSVRDFYLKFSDIPAAKLVHFSFSMPI